MPADEVNFWNDSIFGIVFEGRTPNPTAPVRYISGDTKIAVFVLPDTAAKWTGGGMKIS